MGGGPTRNGIHEWVRGVRRRERWWWRWGSLSVKNDGIQHELSLVRALRVRKRTLSKPDRKE